MVFLIFVLLGVHDTWVCSFHQIWKNFSYYHCKYFFWFPPLIFPHFSFWPPITCMLDFMYCTTVHNTLHIYFQYFFSLFLILNLNLNCYDFSFLDLFSSIEPKMLLISFTYFFISYFIFLISRSSMWIHFVSSISISEVFLYFLEYVQCIYKAVLTSLSFHSIISHFWVYFNLLTFVYGYFPIHLHSW